MGDRGNVAIVTNPSQPPIVIYSHWGGYELAQDVVRALQKRWRWSDESYLARIIFDEVRKDPLTETGIGLDVGYIGDNDTYPIIYIHIPHQAVKLIPYDTDLTAEVDMTGSRSFEDLCKDPEVFINDYRS